MSWLVQCANRERGTEVCIQNLYCHQIARSRLYPSMLKRFFTLSHVLVAAPFAALSLVLAIQSTGSQDADTSAVDDKGRLPALGAAVALEDLDIVARVNGRIIPKASIDAVIAQLPADAEIPERDAVIDEVIDMEILAQAAESDGLHERPEIAAELMLQYTQTLANAWVAEQNRLAENDAEKLRELYGQHVDSLPNDEYRASHILVETADQADNLLAQLNDGADFNSLSAENSIDPNTYLGWVTSRSAAPEIVAALSTLEVGAYGPSVVATDYGYHLVRLDETRRAPRPDFDAVKPRLVSIVVRETVDSRLAELRDAAVITGR